MFCNDLITGKIVCIVVFPILLPNLVDGQKGKTIYNTKINSAHKVYIKNAGGITYITKSDSVVIIDSSTKAQDTVKVDVRIPGNNNTNSPKIFIIDPLPVTAFQHDIDGQFKGYHFVKFSSLTTTLGKSLPDFETPPSVLIFSSSNSPLKLGDIRANGFYIFTEDKNGDKFTAWISEKKKVFIKPIANAGDDQIIQLHR